MGQSGLLDAAIQEIDKLKKNVAKQRGPQIRALNDCELIRAYTFAWTRTHRVRVESFVGEDLNSIDSLYSTLANATYRATSKSQYLKIIKELREALIKLQGLIFLTPVTARELVLPNISGLIQNKEMTGLLQRRMQEILNSLDKSPLTATIMMGAVLEALFLTRINLIDQKRVIFSLKSAPKDKTGKTKELKEWGLNDYIEVGHEIGWIRKPLKDVSGILRDYRNIIHPVKELALMREMKTEVLVNSSDAKMFWVVFVELAEQLSKTEKFD